MKRLCNWLMLTLAVSCLALATSGCKKESSEGAVSGTRVSLTELRSAFEDVHEQEVLTALDQTLVSVHTGQYATTLAALDKLANYSGATANQKKVTAKVISEVKAMVAKGQAPAAPAAR